MTTTRVEDSGLTFEVPINGGLDGDAVLARVDIAEMGCLGLEAPGGRWELDSVRLFDREHLTIRPVEVRVGTRAVEITVFTAASAEDAEVAAALAYAIASLVGAPIRAPDLAEVLLPDDFRARHGRLWARQFERECYERLVAAGVGDAERVEVPSLRGTLAVGPRLLAQVRRTADPAMALRDGFRRVVWIDREDVHVGHTTVMAVGESEVRLGTWARGVPTLLAAGTLHAVALEDGLTTTYLPLPVVADVPRALWLTEDLLLAPAMDDTNWYAFVERSRSSVITDVNALAGPKLAVTTADTGQLTTWTPEAVVALDRSAQNALRSGAVIAMLIIAGADGVIEPKELAAFRDWLDAASKRTGPMAVLFPLGAADAVVLLNATTKSNIPVTSLFVTTLAALKGHVSRRARHEYADELRALALHVAEASSGTGWFAFLRPKVSAEERTALETVDTMLARITSA